MSGEELKNLMLKVIAQTERVKETAEKQLIKSCQIIESEKDEYMQQLEELKKAKLPNIPSATRSKKSTEQLSFNPANRVAYFERKIRQLDTKLMNTRKEYNARIKSAEGLIRLQKNRMEQLGQVGDKNQIRAELDTWNQRTRKIKRSANTDDSSSSYGRDGSRRSQRDSSESETSSRRRCRSNLSTYIPPNKNYVKRKSLYPEHLSKNSRFSDFLKKYDGKPPALPAIGPDFFDHRNTRSKISTRHRKGILKKRLPETESTPDLRGMQNSYSFCSSINSESSMCSSLSDGARDPYGRSKILRRPKGYIYARTVSMSALPSLEFYENRNSLFDPGNESPMTKEAKKAIRERAEQRWKERHISACSSSVVSDFRSKRVDEVMVPVASLDLYNVHSEPMALAEKINLWSARDDDESVKQSSHALTKNAQDTYDDTFESDASERKSRGVRSIKSIAYSVATDGCVTDVQSKCSEGEMVDLNDPDAQLTQDQYANISKPSTQNFPQDPPRSISIEAIDSTKYRSNIPSDRLSNTGNAAETNDQALNQATSSESMDKFGTFDDVNLRLKLGNKESTGNEGRVSYDSGFASASGTNLGSDPETPIFSDRHLLKIVSNKQDTENLDCNTGTENSSGYSESIYDDYRKCVDEHSRPLLALERKLRRSLDEIRDGIPGLSSRTLVKSENVTPRSIDSVRGTDELENTMSFADQDAGDRIVFGVSSEKNRKFVSDGISNTMSKSGTGLDQQAASYGIDETCTTKDKQSDIVKSDQGSSDLDDNHDVDSLTDADLLNNNSTNQGHRSNVGLPELQSGEQKQPQTYTNVGYNGYHDKKLVDKKYANGSENNYMFEVAEVTTIQKDGRKVSEDRLSFGSYSEGRKRMKRRTTSVSPARDVSSLDIAIKFKSAGSERVRSKSTADCGSMSDIEKDARQFRSNVFSAKDETNASQYGSSPLASKYPSDACAPNGKDPTISLHKSDKKRIDFQENLGLSGAYDSAWLGEHHTFIASLPTVHKLYHFDPTMGYFPSTSHILASLMPDDPPRAYSTIASNRNDARRDSTKRNILARPSSASSRKRNNSDEHESSNVASNSTQKVTETVDIEESRTMSNQNGDTVNVVRTDHSIRTTDKESSKNDRLRHHTSNSHRSEASEPESSKKELAGRAGAKHSTEKSAKGPVLPQEPTSYKSNSEHAESTKPRISNISSGRNANVKKSIEPFIEERYIAPVYRQEEETGKQKTGYKSKSWYLDDSDKDTSNVRDSHDAVDDRNTSKTASTTSTTTTTSTTATASSTAASTVISAGLDGRRSTSSTGSSFVEPRRPLRDFTSEESNVVEEAPCEVRYIQPLYSSSIGTNDLEKREPQPIKSDHDDITDDIDDDTYSSNESELINVKYVDGVPYISIEADSLKSSEVFSDSNGNPTEKAVYSDGKPKGRFRLENVADSTLLSRNRVVSSLAKSLPNVFIGSEDDREILGLCKTVSQSLQDVKDNAFDEPDDLSEPESIDSLPSVADDHPAAVYSIADRRIFRNAFPYDANLPATEPDFCVTRDDTSRFLSKSRNGSTSSGVTVLSLHEEREKMGQRMERPKDLPLNTAAWSSGPNLATLTGNERPMFFTELSPRRTDSDEFQPLGHNSYRDDDDNDVKKSVSWSDLRGRPLEVGPSGKSSPWDDSPKPIIKRRSLSYDRGGIPITRNDSTDEQERAEPQIDDEDAVRPISVIRDEEELQQALLTPGTFDAVSVDKKLLLRLLVSPESEAILAGLTTQSAVAQISLVHAALDSEIFPEEATEEDLRDAEKQQSPFSSPADGAPDMSTSKNYQEMIKDDIQKDSFSFGRHTSESMRNAEASICALKVAKATENMLETQSGPTDQGDQATANLDRYHEKSIKSKDEKEIQDKQGVLDEYRKLIGDLEALTIQRAGIMDSLGDGVDNDFEMSSTTRQYLSEYRTKMESIKQDLDQRIDEINARLNSLDLPSDMQHEVEERKKTIFGSTDSLAMAKSERYYSNEDLNRPSDFRRRAGSRPDSRLTTYSASAHLGGQQSSFEHRNKLLQLRKCLVSTCRDLAESYADNVLTRYTARIGSEPPALTRSAHTHTSTHLFTPDSHLTPVELLDEFRRARLSSRAEIGQAYSDLNRSQPRLAMSFESTLPASNDWELRMREKLYGAAGSRERLTIDKNIDTEIEALAKYYSAIKREYEPSRLRDNDWQKYKTENVRLKREEMKRDMGSSFFRTY